MNEQEQPTMKRKIALPTEVTPIKVKPRPKLNPGNDDSPADHIGIYLPYDEAKVQSGKNGQWTLSIVTVTAPIQGFTIYEGASESEDYNETNLNCLTFSSPKRIEIVTNDQIDAPPYLVFQEIMQNNVVSAWQIYAPTPFEIVDPAGAEDKWQNAVSLEPVSIKQIRLYEDCNFNIEQTPPSIPGALFQKVTTTPLSEVDLWR